MRQLATDPEWSLMGCTNPLRRDVRVPHQGSRVNTRNKAVEGESSLAKWAVGIFWIFGADEASSLYHSLRHYYESSERATARQHKVEEVACY